MNHQTRKNPVAFLQDGNKLLIDEDEFFECLDANQLQSEGGVS